MTITTRSLPPAGTQTTRVWRPVLTALGAAVIAACGGGGGGDGGTPPPSAGSPPSVSTTNQIVVSAGDPVSLSASATDPDGDTISFSWRQDSGASVANTTGFDSSSASFTANSEVDTLQFTVTATANGQSDSETVYVIIVEDISTAVFIDKDATGTPDGSIDNPFTELRSTFENAPNDSDFYIRTPASGERYVINGDNDSLQSLGSGQSVYGGYGADWVRDPELNKTPIDSVRVGVYHLNVAAPTVVSGLEIDIQAVEGDSTSGSLFGVLGQGSGAGSYTVADNSIVVDSVTARSSSASSAPVVGVYLTNLPTAAVRDNTMALGDGSPATDRGGRTLDAGRDGVPGEDARVGDNQTGGDPGASSGGGWNGGRGGDAGTTSFEPGDGGGRGSGRTSPVVVSGGSGGTLGSDALGNRNAGDGADGDNGPRGPGGSGGSGRGSTGPNGVYAGVLGGLGSDGWAGGGGGGGGGGSAGAAGVNGGAGGGGGEGGDGGSGGFGGAQGGASIGIHLARVTASDISGNDITTGNGATGGRGGAGSEGGSGGSGGLGVAGTNGLGDNDGGRGGDGGAGGSGGSGGFGGSGGGGPAFGIFFGGDSGGAVTGNTITTGNGGTGAAARDSNELASAGEGGWSVGIFDADTADGIAITQSGNTFAIGTPGANGAPSTGTGTAMETNLP